MNYPPPYSGSDADGNSSNIYPSVPSTDPASQDYLNANPFGGPDATPDSMPIAAPAPNPVPAPAPAPDQHMLQTSASQGTA